MDVRFLLDEHIDHAIAAALRLRGYDIRTLADANLLGADDSKRILPFALQEGRVLVTRDADFLALHAEGHAHAGIAFWRGTKRNAASTGPQRNKGKHGRAGSLYQIALSVKRPPTGQFWGKENGGAQF